MSHVPRDQSRTVAVARGVAALSVAMLMLVPASLATATQVAAPSGRVISSHSGASSNTLFGTTVSSNPNLQAKTVQFGHMPVIHVYYTGLPPSDAWTTEPGAENHSAVIVSFFAPPSAVLSGADDSSIAHFFDTAPTGYPIYYGYIHEPEANIQAGQFTAAAYRAAWADVAKLADAAHNPDLHSTLILMGWTVNPYSHRDWRDYLPPGGIISTLAWDVYPDGGYGVAPPAEWMAPEVKVSEAAGIPFGFAEFNTTTVQGRPAWLTSVGSYCRSVGALFCTLFDSIQIGGLARHGGTFVVSDSASIAAWRQVIQGS